MILERPGILAMDECRRVSIPSRDFMILEPISVDGWLTLILFQSLVGIS